MFIAFVLVLIGLLVQPIWRSWFFGQSVPAYIAGLAIVAAGWFVLFHSMLRKLRVRRKDPRQLRALRWGLLLLTLTSIYLAAELIATAYIVMAQRRMELYEFRHKELLAGTAIFDPHPFLLFTKNPALPNVNDYGFFGDEWTLEKPADTIRVACLGGSTTEDGYPYFMEEILKSGGRAQKFQCMNFGTAGWTSAHSLINYSLNVRHLAPDIIIIHDAANDFKSVGFSNPRTDYSHAFQNPLPLSDPWDALLVRHLNSYALGKMTWQRARKIPPGPSLSEIVEKKPDAYNLADAQISSAVGVFGENINALITLALADGARVILTTMPHSRTDDAWSSEFIIFMNSANETLRTISEDRNIPLADLDEQIQAEEFFNDPVHLTSTAIKLKAQILAGAVNETLSTTLTMTGR